MTSASTFVAAAWLFVRARKTSVLVARYINLITRQRHFEGN
jgi:hypothetical protein